MKNLFRFLALTVLLCPAADSLHAQWIQVFDAGVPDGSYVSGFTVSGNNIIAGIDDWISGIHGGLYRSTDDGTNWTNISSGLVNNNVIALTRYIDETNTEYIFAGIDNFLNNNSNNNNTIFRSLDNGDNWYEAFAGVEGTSICSFALSSNGTSGKNIFAVTNYNKVYISTNNGINWINITNGIPSDGNFFNTLTTAENESGGSYLVLGTNISGVFISTDNGASWNTANNGLTSLSINRLAWNPTTKTIFAGCGAGLFRSVDYGESWTPQNNGLSRTDIMGFAIDENGNIFIGTGGGISLSTDNGSSWSDVNLGLNDFNVFSIALNEQFVFIGTYNGKIWRRPISEMVTNMPIIVVIDIHPGSTDNPINLNAKGKVPIAIITNNNFDAATVDISTIKFGPNKAPVLKGCLEDIDMDGDLDLMMHFNNKETGITKTDTKAELIGKTFAGIDIKGSDSIKIVGNLKKERMENATEDSIPKTYSLLQNYPNPFNPSTTIQFSLPQEGFTTIKIYNSLGQEAAQLVSQYLNSGIYSIEWNASDFSSGVYYYIINAGRFTETKKLLLLK